MQIDWLTVAAQIVNFLVLVWLLQHFLYGPIVRAMDRREQRIAGRLKEAAEKKEEAEKEADTYRRKQRELEERRDRMLADAREKANEERSSLEKSAREEVDKRKQEWMEQLDDQQRTFLQDIRRLAADRFSALARRALRDLADEELEDQIARVFLDKLQGLDDKERRKFEKACRGAAGKMIVRSRFELPAGTRGSITRAIHDRLCEEAEVEYRQADRIACGIELSTGSQELAWGLDAYLDDIEKALAAELTSAKKNIERSAAE